MILQRVFRAGAGGHAHGAAAGFAAVTAGVAGLGTDDFVAFGGVFGAGARGAAHGAATGFATEGADEFTHGGTPWFVFFGARLGEA